MLNQNQPPQEDELSAQLQEEVRRHLQYLRALHEQRSGERPPRLSRPPLLRPRQPAKGVTTIRLSSEVLEAFKATGKGWQTRLDALLLEAVRAGRVKPEAGNLKP